MLTVPGPSMRCPACGFENASGIKFCGGCGASLKLKCVSCGFENPALMKFCGECGKPLSEASKPEPLPDPRSYSPKHLADRILAEQAAMESRGAQDGERKTITALFEDIKSSVELMENLDPEKARAIVDPALQLMIDAVQSYESYVAQSRGDGIFALFGAPIAQEDLAQRALYAALRMQEDIKRYSDRLRIEKVVHGPRGRAGARGSRGVSQVPGGGPPGEAGDHPADAADDRPRRRQVARDQAPW